MAEKMSSKERVLCALNLQEPDRVPYIEATVDIVIYRKLTGKEGAGPDAGGILKGTGQTRTVEMEKEISRLLNRDNVNFRLNAPVYAAFSRGKDDREFFGQGGIRTWDNLERMKLPDPYDDRLYEPAKVFVRGKEDFAACAGTRLGVGPAMLSMGMEHFWFCLHDDPGLVQEILRRYTEWASVVLGRFCDLGFDFLFCADDVAFKTGPMMSPLHFREIILPHLRTAVKNVTIPWVYHSDGNLLPIMEDWLSLGQSGIHPVEPMAMDIRHVKKHYGQRVCICGNVDVNTLSMGSEQDVEAEVRSLIGDLAPGGGYMVSSGNSVPAYARPENALAMGRAVRKYGKYPISLSQCSDA
jgi:hypothetical protein